MTAPKVSELLSEVTCPRAAERASLVASGSVARVFKLASSDRATAMVAAAAPAPATPTRAATARATDRSPGLSVEAHADFGTSSAMLVFVIVSLFF